MTQAPSTGRSKHGLAPWGSRHRYTQFCSNRCSRHTPVGPERTDIPKRADMPNETDTSKEHTRTSFTPDSFCTPIVKDEHPNCISLGSPNR
jgi:hypothetical protein